MNNLMRYLIPVALALLALFNFYNQNWLEGILYVAVGVAFPLQWALRDGKIKENVKFWNAVSWVLIILALVLFLALLRTDAHTAQ
jgi:hypothetical protein